MAVIITDMEMPKGCFECPLREEHGLEGDWCAVSEGYDLIGETTRPDYCPLKEVKECEALGQESILDKIRAEIKALPIAFTSSFEMKQDCLDILGKYKAESEDKE